MFKLNVQGQLKVRYQQ